MQTDSISTAADQLGECPVWCERTSRLWWVDVLTPKLWSFDPLTRHVESHVFTAQRLGSIALRKSGGLILACDDGLYAFDPDTREQRFLVDPEPDAMGHRKNDGRAAPNGDFWIGTLEEASYKPEGSLFRVTGQLECSMQESQLSIPNGLAFDEKQGRMYFADTRAYTIWQYDYDVNCGSVRNKQIFATTDAPARPDGSCVDAEGCLWNAEYGGGRVVRFSPQGERIFSIELPITYPTCCCFGGDDLSTLYVTSASQPLDEVQLRSEPLAGHTFAMKPGVVGKSEYLVNL